MSSPKDKAKELVGKMENTPHCGIEHFPSKHYCDCSEINFFQAKQCALVAVDEIIKDLKESLKVAEDLHLHARGLIMGSFVDWQEVKKEIEKL